MSAITEAPIVNVPVRPQPPWFRSWFRVMTQPTVRSYAYVLSGPTVSFGRALKWIILASIAGGLLSWGIEPGFLSIDTSSDYIQYSVGLDFGVVLRGIATFLLYVFLLHGLARALGGQGSYRQFAFLSACYSSSLVLLVGVLSGVDSAIAASQLVPASFSPGRLHLVGEATLYQTNLWVTCGSILVALARFGYNIALVLSGFLVCSAITIMGLVFL